VGDHLTIADIGIATSLVNCFQWVWDDKYRKSIIHLTKWFEHIASLESWKKVFGRLILCKQALPFFMVEDEPEEEKKPEPKVEKSASKQDKSEKAKEPEKKPAAKKPKDEDSDGAGQTEEEKKKKSS